MPQDYIATFDDGTTYLVEKVPDNVHPNDALAWTEKQFGQRVKSFEGQGRGFWGEMKEVGKDIARGFGHGANLTGSILSASPESYDAGAAAVEKTFPTPKGDSTARTWLRAGLEGLGGAVTGPGIVSAPLRTLLAGGAAGVGSKAGEELGGTPGAIAGGIVGGGGVSAAAGARPTRQALVNRTVEGLSDAELAAAQRFMQQSGAEGVDLNLSQALGRPSNVDAMTEALANSQHGRATVEQLRNQPEQVQGAVASRTAALPGTVRDQQKVANEVQDASTGILTDVKKARTALVEPLYSTVGDLGPRAPMTLAATIDTFLKQPGISDATRERASALRGKLLDTGGKPRTHALDIKAALDDFRSDIKSTVNPVNPKAQGELKYLAGQLQTQLGQKSPVLGIANKVYSDISANVVDPLKKSVVGRMAQPAGAQADKEAVRSKVFSVFDKGTLPSAQSSEILTLERSLRNGKQAEVFQDAAKTWLAEKVAGATSTSGGRADPWLASSLKSALVGNDIQRQGFRDVMVGLARSKGLPDDALLPGMEKLIAQIEATAKRPGRVSGVSERELVEAGRSKLVESAGRMNVIQPLKPLQRLNDWLHADSYQFMDKLLTTPEGVELLRNMAKKPLVSKSVADSLTTFLATQSQTETAGE